MKKIVVTIWIITLMGCKEQKNNYPVQGKWIKGTNEEQIKIIENQFRGFDNAMIETGYRYQELYWAGQEQNWDYANYQLNKIETAIKNGLERRPKRAKSAEYFLTYVLPQMKESLDEKDVKIFNKAFETLTTNCNNCHSMEKVPYFSVKIPKHKQSPITK